MKRIVTLSLLTSVVLYADVLYAAPPTAGTLLQTVKPVTPPTKQKSLPNMQIQHYAPAMQSKSSVKIMVKHFTINENTVFKSSRLHSLISAYEGKQLTLAQINKVADNITEYYRSHGYFVARAYIPAQDVIDNTIKIEIIEGKYGKFDFTNTSLVKTDVLHSYLDPLTKEKALYYPDLERRLLLINLLSGVKIVSADIFPGKKIGESNFAVKTVKTPRAQVYAIADDYGDNYTGGYRATAGLMLNSLTGYGDSLNISGMRSNTGGLSNAQLGYTIPLGYSGVKANAFASMTRYTLQKQYTPLDAHGQADQIGVGLSYPLILNQKHSLDISTTVSSVKETDYINQTQSVKRVNVLNIALDDIHHHQIFSKAADFQGTLSLTGGKVLLNNDTARSNDTILNSKGYFTKANMSAKEKLYINAKLNIQAKLSGQGAFNKNLDASQQFTLGGTGGVRAYTTSELSADEAVLFSLDINHTLPNYKGISHQVGIFYDTGYAWLNTVAYTTDNTRQLSDIGISYKANYKKLFLSASLATGGIGIRAQTSAQNNSQFFVQAGVVF